MAGFKYDLKAENDALKEVLRFDTVYRISGGFNLDTEGLAGYLSVAAPLFVDFETRKAYALRNVKTIEAVAATDTTIKVEKNSLIAVGAFLGNGTKGATVKAVDKSNANFDAIEIEEAGLTAKKGEVLFEAKAATGKEPKYKANVLNYAQTQIKEGVTITAIGKAFEIRSSLLAISEKDKENLGHRFMFTY